MAKQSNNLLTAGFAAFFLWIVTIALTTGCICFAENGWPTETGRWIISIITFLSFFGYLYEWAENKGK
jgi:hypothetical protein